MLLVVVQLLGGNDTRLLPRGELADLLKGKQLVDGTGVVVHHETLREQLRLHNATSHHHGTHVLEAADAHEHGGHGLVATGHKDATVKAARTGLSLDKVNHGVAVRQGVVDAVVALRNAIAHVGSKVACRAPMSLAHTLTCLCHQLVKMCGARMAVAKRGGHHHLWKGKLRDGPPHAHAEGIGLGCELTNGLASQLCHDWLLILRLLSLGYEIALGTISPMKMRMVDWYGASGASERLRPYAYAMLVRKVESATRIR